MHVCVLSVDVRPECVNVRKHGRTHALHNFMGFTFIFEVTKNFTCRDAEAKRTQNITGTE